VRENVTQRKLDGIRTDKEGNVEIIEAGGGSLQRRHIRCRRYAQHGKAQGTPPAGLDRFAQGIGLPLRACHDHRLARQRVLHVTPCVIPGREAGHVQSSAARISSAPCARSSSASERPICSA
jgi:hypothetical protein